MKKYSVVTVIVIATFCFLFIILRPEIVLNGESVIEIPVFSSYQELGATVKTPLSKKSHSITITGSVNTSKIGSYTITYEAKIQNRKYRKNRIVKVVDQEPPRIVLNGDMERTLCPNTTYEEEGYQASDTYDGDLTSSVLRKEFVDKIVYQVEDSSHNSFSITRSFIREDQESPVITLKGSNTITLYIGDYYQEPGYEARDTCEGDLTSKVSVEGTVNTQTKGTYELTYQVEDSNQNMASIKRVVQVLPKPDNTGKVIYLTFDDGPSRSITPKLLEILKEENVKATFFLINHDASLDYLIQEEFNQGHTVAIHSYTHNYRQIYASENAYFQDLQLMSDKIYNLTGKRPSVMRFPGGSSNTVSRFNPGIMTRLTQEVTRRGYTYYDWNVGSGDAGEVRSSAQVYQNVIQSLNSKTNIVLMHDFENNYYTLNAIRDIIQYGKRMGYTFQAIGENTPAVHHRINN